MNWLKVVTGTFPVAIFESKKGEVFYIMLVVLSNKSSDYKRNNT